MTKFYHIENANRRVGGVLFEIYEIDGGCAMGIYQSEDPAVIEALDALVSNPASAVTALTEAEFERLSKKKVRRLPGYAVLKSSSGPQATPLKGDGRAVVVENPLPSKAEVKEGIAEDEALAVVPVAAPKNEKILAKPGKKA